MLKFSVEALPHVIGMRIVGVRQRRQVPFQHVIIVGQVVVIPQHAGIALGQRPGDFRGVLPIQLNHSLDQFERRPGSAGGRAFVSVQWTTSDDVIFDASSGSRLFVTPAASTAWRNRMPPRRCPSSE